MKTIRFNTTWHEGIVPVMWGAACDMDANMAQRHNLILVEGACQGVGGTPHFS
jgi:dTDP-4-amino-4,6-dideoxygalactose transaminase